MLIFASPLGRANLKSQISNFRSQILISHSLIALPKIFIFVYMIAEAIGGYLANSLALLSDAGHMLTDVAALALSLLAVRFASRRLEILAALVNGAALIVLSLLICFEAYQRLRQTEEVQ